LVAEKAARTGNGMDVYSVVMSAAALAVLKVGEKVLAWAGGKGAERAIGKVEKKERRWVGGTAPASAAARDV
jgi:hypothetical protein